MQKKSWTFFLSLLAINFASAYGYYGDSLINELFYRIEPTSMFLMLSFIVLFAILNWALARFFKDNKTVAGVIAFSLSLGTVYEFWRRGFNIDDFFYDLGLGGLADLFYTLLPLVGFGVIIYLAIRFRRDTLWILGLLLIGLSFFAYEKETLWLLGGLLILIWFLWRVFSGRSGNPNFPQTPGSPNSPQQQAQSGLPTLKSEAKAFRNWADRQSNPKMHRNWAQFIHYLKSNGYGGNENEICSNLNVTRNDIVWVVKKYIN